jgi:hypothetical protein
MPRLYIDDATRELKIACTYHLDMYGVAYVDILYSLNAKTPLGKQEIRRAIELRHQLPVGSVGSIDILLIQLEGEGDGVFAQKGYILTSEGESKVQELCTTEANNIRKAALRLSGAKRTQSA